MTSHAPRTSLCLACLMLPAHQVQVDRLVSSKPLSDTNSQQSEVPQKNVTCTPRILGKKKLPSIPCLHIFRWSGITVFASSSSIRVGGYKAGIIFESPGSKAPKSVKLTIGRFVFPVKGHMPRKSLKHLNMKHHELTGQKGGGYTTLI